MMDAIITKGGGLDFLPDGNVQQLVHNKTQRCQEKTWINHTMFRCVCVCDQVDDKQYILVEKKNPCCNTHRRRIYTIFLFWRRFSHHTTNKKKKNDDGAHPLSLFQSKQTHTE